MNRHNPCFSLQGGPEESTSPLTAEEGLQRVAWEMWRMISSETRAGASWPCDCESVEELNQFAFLQLLMEFLKISFPNIFLYLAGLSSVARIRQICSVTSLVDTNLEALLEIWLHSLEEAQPALTFPEQRMGVAGGKFGWRIWDGCDGQVSFAPYFSLWFHDSRASDFGNGLRNGIRGKRVRISAIWV